MSAGVSSCSRHSAREDSQNIGRHFPANAERLPWETDPPPFTGEETRKCAVANDNASRSTIMGSAHTRGVRELAG